MVFGRVVAGCFGFIRGGGLLMAKSKMSPQRAELYRLREYGRKVAKMKRQSERASKLRAVASFGGKS
jgi:hypothetical protein